MSPNAQPRLSTDDVDDLVYACRTGDLDWLQELLKTHSQSLNLSESEVITSAIDVDEDGLGSRACLLHYPAANGNLDIVSFLLDRLLSSTSNGAGATFSSNTRSSTNAGIDISDGNIGNSNLNAGSKAFVNHQNINGNTPLHWAALNGHVETVKALVKAGADPTLVNEAGRDAVVEAEYSSKEGAADCAHWLLKECEVLEKGAGAGPSGQDAFGNDDDHQEGDEVVAKSTNSVNGEVHDSGKDDT